MQSSVKVFLFEILTVLQLSDQTTKPDFHYNRGVFNRLPADTLLLNQNAPFKTDFREEICGDFFPCFPDLLRGASEPFIDYDESQLGFQTNTHAYGLEGIGELRSIEPRTVGEYGYEGLEDSLGRPRNEKPFTIENIDNLDMSSRGESGLIGRSRTTPAPAETFINYPGVPVYFSQRYDPGEDNIPESTTEVSKAFTPSLVDPFKTFDYPATTPASSIQPFGQRTSFMYQPTTPTAFINPSTTPTRFDSPTTAASILHISSISNTIYLLSIYNTLYIKFSNIKLSIYSAIYPIYLLPFYNTLYI